MMAGNPNYWWGMYPQLSSPSHQFVYGSSSSTTDSSLLDPNSCIPDDQDPNQDFPVRSWSQLLLGGEEDKNDSNIFEEGKKLENWEILNLNPEPAAAISYTSTARFPVDDVQKEGSQSNYISQLFSHQESDHDHANNYKPSNKCITSFISPTSSTTTSTLSNIFNFSGGTVEEEVQRRTNHHQNYHECNFTGGVSKKPRIQQFSVQEPYSKVKVSKEKVRDRITALHQIVSPFGKTDTASVLSEAIGFIRYLQAHIEDLSSPYMRHASESRVHHQQQNSDSVGVINKDLRSLGLCLVPISCTQLIGINDNGGGRGADYWATPTTLGGGGGF